MKKVIIALAVMAMAVGSHADIYASMFVDFGVWGNGAEGGIVDDVVGTKILATVIDGNGDGIDYQNGNQVVYNPNTGAMNLLGNDTLIGEFSLTIDAAGTFQNEGFGLISIVGGAGIANTADAYIVVNGTQLGDWAWVGQQGVDFNVFEDKIFGATPPTPQTVSFAGTADGSTSNAIADGSIAVAVIPEPATFGLMGIAGLGLFLARKKARS